jgi:outer membrane protein assembly factor BamB
LFAEYGGVRDLLFIGTSSDPGVLRALRVSDGQFVEDYTGTGAQSGGPFGPILGMPAIRYPNRVYFASRRGTSGDTLFCLEVTSPPTTPIFSYKWSRDFGLGPNGGIIGSPVLRGGRVYVGTEGGTIYSINADTGNQIDDHTFTAAPLDGPVKGFLFPDRRNNDLLFATDTKVWSISDDGPSMTKNWEWTTAGLNPSIVLFRPQSTFVYVGSAAGVLYQLDFSKPVGDAAFAKSLTLGGGASAGKIGAPSIDLETKLLVVGSEAGVIYGVDVDTPFP